MRFIEQKQLSSDLRVETSSTYTECCQKVADSLDENEGGLTTVVSLLVTNIEQYHTVNIKGSFFSFKMFYRKYYFDVI